MKNKCSSAYQDTNLTGSFEINSLVVFPKSTTILYLFLFLEKVRPISKKQVNFLEIRTVLVTTQYSKEIYCSGMVKLNFSLFITS